ncbi:MAG: molybdenum cofactor biosynthesis protein MoaE [Holophagaceae bacterium]|jgi:molybdopterin synthase catalytic subunit
MDFPKILLTSAPLAVDQLREALKNPTAGAVVIFEGRARNHHEGRTVLKLFYEAYDAMAYELLTQLREDALHRFQLTECMIHHRTGDVPITETSVVIGCTSAHRRESFQATMWLMDTIKSQLPIWKKEFYEDQTSAWVECDHRYPSRS